MKTSSIILLASLVIVQSASAGLVLEQETDTGSILTKSVMFIQDGLIRTDAGESVTSISNTRTGEVITLLHESKQIMTIKPGPEGRPPADVKLPEPKYTDTGKTEKVDGHDCRIVRMEMEGTTSTFWVADAYPDHDKIKAELQTLTRIGNQAAAIPELNGMILKTATVSSGYVAVTRVTAARVEKIDPARFETPQGYTTLGRN